jgi:hypothetical protein
MSRPITYYSSANMPNGSRSVSFKRLTDPLLPAGASATLGTYLLESCGPKEPSQMIERFGTKKEPTDFNIVAGRKTMSVTAQLATNATPTLQVGDFFEDTFDVTAAGAPEAAERYVVHECDSPEVAGEARKQTLSLILDVNNSPRWA